MENESKWGAVWTYALICSIVLLGGIIALMLSEDKRDRDAAAYDYVSQKQENQIREVGGYVLAMPNGTSKTHLLSMLDTIHVLRTRKEVMAKYDTLMLNDIDTTTVVNSIIITEIKYENGKYNMTIEGLDSSQEQCFQTNILMNAIEHGDVDVTNEICIPAVSQ